MRQKAILQRAKWRGCGQGWGNMDRAFKVEAGSRNKKIFKYKISLLFWQNLGSLNTSYLACVAGAWKWWAQEKTGARERDTRGERELNHPSRAPVLSFAHYFQAPATQATSTSYPESTSITQASILSLIWISVHVFYLLIISLLCSLNANNISTRLTTLSSLCEHVDNEYVAV